MNYVEAIRQHVPASYSIIFVLLQSTKGQVIESILVVVRQTQFQIQIIDEADKAEIEADWLHARI
jgi:hypothetical protein